jgi:hypothetical protein
MNRRKATQSRTATLKIQGRSSVSQKARYARVRRWIQERLEAVRTATPEQLAADRADWEKLAKSMNADRARAKSRPAF